MSGHLNKIGNSLKGAVGAFNDTVGSLEKRFLPTARKLDGLVTTDKSVPELVPVAEQPQALQAPELDEQLRAIDAA
jgi:DNA recombination protein RmuC